MEHQDSDICSGSKSSCLTGGMHLVSGFWEIFRIFFFFFFPRSLELHLAKRKISGNITTYVLFFVQDARVKYEQINLHHKGQTPFLFHQPPVKWHSNATSSVNPNASKHKPYSFFLINTAKPWKTHIRILTLVGELYCQGLTVHELWLNFSLQIPQFQKFCLSWQFKKVNLSLRGHSSSLQTSYTFLKLLYVILRYFRVAMYSISSV